MYNCPDAIINIYQNSEIMTVAFRFITILRYLTEVKIAGIKTLSSNVFMLFKST